VTPIAGARYAAEQIPAAPLTPADLPSVIGWYRADNPPSVIASAGKVSQLSDLSVAANHLVQPSSSVQYTTGVATQNGRNVLTVPTGVPWMERTLTTPFPNTTATVIYVGVWQPSGAWCRGLSLWGSGDWLEWLVVSGGPDFRWRQAGANYSDVLNPQTWGYHVFRRNGAALDVWKDATKLPGGGGAGTANVTTLTLGTDDGKASGGNVAGTQIGELIVSTAAISDAQIAALRTDYVRPRWATP